MLVPSALAVNENNWLINPQHAEFKQIAVNPVESLRYDPRMFRQGQSVGNLETSSSAQNDRYALAASWLPSGKKYCVPLIGAETFRSSSCKSWLRSTKSISEVFTISRSDDV